MLLLRQLSADRRADRRHARLFVRGGRSFSAAFFLFSAIFLTPRLGVAVVMSTVIAGQLISAVLLDKFGVIGMAVREATPGRLVGVALMIAGVVMIRVL